MAERIEGSRACGSAASREITRASRVCAVGGWLGTGSVFGPGTKCTYEVTPASAGGDRLRGSYSLEMTGVAKGTCTVTASVLGQTSTQTITVQ